MKVPVTGAAGFVGVHDAAAPLARSDGVGHDNLNDHYDARLKPATPGAAKGRTK